MIAVGVQTWGTDVAALRRYWRAAEALGYARILYGDGLGPWTHDGWTMLGALAVLTRRARIGHAVTYAFDPAAHHAAWLAKRAVAVDHLSSGRFELRLAVGAEAPAAAEGWRAHGIAYPPPGERLARLEAAVTAVRGLWQGGLQPLPRQRPGPPVWIAAMGPRALAAVARHADGWEASFLTPRALAEQSAALDTLLAGAGRAPAGVRRAVELDAIVAGSPAERAALIGAFCEARGIAADHPLLDAVLAGEPAALVARVRAYAGAGATDLTLGFADFPATGMLEAFARRVLPALAEPAAAAGGRR